MKKLIFSILALLMTFPVMSQNTPKADSRVADFFGNAKIQTWATQNPDSIRYYNFFVNHSFEIWTAENAALRSDSKNAAIVSLSTENFAALENLSEFNILKTGLKWSKDQTLWFSIEDSEYYLMLQPLNYIDNKFKAGK